MISKKDFKKINDVLWELPKSDKTEMRVPARIYASEKMLENALIDESIVQLTNVATLPGVLKYSIAMPDIHEGYGFPIGGVAAMKMEGGVISPGGVGFDINCIHPDSKINLSFGSYLSVKDLRKYWKSISLSLLNKQNKKLKDTSIISFFSRQENNSLYSIKTKSGFFLKVTADHPIFTGKEMKKSEKLKTQDKIVLYPFSGICYEEPKTGEIINEKKIKLALDSLNLGDNGNRHPQIIKWLKEKGFLNLKYNSWQTPYLIKILGFIFGDGTANFIGKRKKGQISFYGKLEDLKAIKADLGKLGISSYIYTRRRNHIIRTRYGISNFSFEEHCLFSHSTGLVLLLYVLGLPLGNKTAQKFRVPRWLNSCPLWQKRLFLASFFGAELSKPATINKYNFYAPTLNINKAKIFAKNGKDFLNDIRNLLREFNVRSSEVAEVEELGNFGFTTGLRFQIFERMENLIIFFQTVGFEYNLEKQKLSCLAVGFLKEKQKILEIRKGTRELVKNLYSQGIPARELVLRYKMEFLGKRFIEHSIWSQRGMPRIAFNFCSFADYIKDHQFGNHGFITDEIEEIKKEPYCDLVYDLTVNHSDHNFIANNFVVSNCGMRVLKSSYSEKDLKPYLENLASEIQRQVPSGLGRGRKIKFSIKEIDKILEGGAKELVRQGYGENDDIANCEAGGVLTGADSSLVSDRAKNRGRDQVGTLGSGNHFLEIQKVAEIFDENIAEVFGLFKDQAIIMIHTGSRGLGHQIATDYIQVMMRAMPKYGINLPDKELAACPINSPEGKRYFSAMCCGANYAWANRQMISHFVRQAWKTILGEKASPLVQLYDVAHNIAKIERHIVDGKEIEVCMHRKGATRAFPPGHPEIPPKYRKAGQPVLIPGSMGTASYILAGTRAGAEAWHSTCHGAGRTMSRHAAMKTISGPEVVKNLEAKGIIVKCWNLRGIAEEAPLAYKNIDEVVDVVHKAGLSKKVAKLVPLAVIKGE